MTTPGKNGLRPDPHVLVISAGGTFGMHATARGLAPDPEFPAALNTLLARASGRLDGSPGPRSTTVFIEPPIDSSEAGPDTALALADAVKKHSAAIPDFSGAIIIHGTDTLAYTGARLAFELHALGHPVILTGSQLPYALAGSDAPANLALALRALHETAPHAHPPAARIAFAGKLLPAVRATKTSSTDLDGFAADLPVAPGTTGIPALSSVPRTTPARIISFRMTPSVVAADLAAVVGGAPDALVLETYGAGNAPISRPGMRETLETIASRIPVVAISQCRTGGVSLGTYAPGFALAEVGVIDGADLTVEAAHAKLGFLLDRGVTQTTHPLSITTLMGRNLIGECASPSLA